MSSNKKEKKNDRYIFPSTTIKHFVKEMVKVNFDFDAFLIGKGAIRKHDGKIIALSYENKGNYLSKHVNGTPYFSLEASMLEWAWGTPYCFWYELKDQSMSELVREVYDVENFEHTRTGKSYTDRAREKMQEVKSSMSSFIASKTMPKYDLSEYQKTI